MSEAAVAERTEAPSETKTETPAAPAGASLLKEAPASAPASNGNGSDAGKTIDMEQDAGGDWRIAAKHGLDEETAGAWDNVAKRYNTPAELAKAHVSLVKTMDKRLPIPESDNDDDWAPVWNKLGRPESVDKYEVSVPKDAQWDETEVQRIKETELPLLWKHGATQKQVDAYIANKAELDRLSVDAWEARGRDLSEADDRSLRHQWTGKAWDENHNLARANAQRLWGDNIDEVASLRTADGRYVLDLPIMKQALARNERNFLEDDRDPSGFNASRITDVKSQIAAIRKDAQEKGLSPSSPGYPHAEIQALYDKMPGAKANEFRK